MSNVRNKVREVLSNVNSLGVAVTRPDQELIIMRGIPGAGKSTRANSIVGEGVIHSTDTLWEATGDYFGAFEKMKESGDWSEHSKMHHKNFVNASRSMEEGVSPVIIDNTNIKAREAKKYVNAALEMGYADENIRVEDVGTNGQTAEVLAERNTHGVPLETIERMIKSHTSVGELTVKKIMEASDGSNRKKVLYSAVVLDEKSHDKLVTALSHFIPEGWKTFAHHMTIVFAKGLPEDLKQDLGTNVNLRATEIGSSDMAIAVKVDGYPSTNDIPHITLAVNTAEGGKPFMSNKITKWTPLDSYINLVGTVTEVKP